MQITIDAKAAAFGALALLLLVLAALLAFTSVSNDDGVDCGSVASPADLTVSTSNVSINFLGEIAQRNCDDAVTGRRTWVILSGVLGAVLGVVAFLMAKDAGSPGDRHEQAYPEQQHPQAHGTGDPPADGT